MIRIVKEANEHVNCYTVWVICSQTKAIPIAVDTGVKPFQAKPAVNVPATGELMPHMACELAKGINVANDLLSGAITIGAPGWTFKSVHR